MAKGFMEILQQIQVTYMLQLMMIVIMMPTVMNHMIALQVLAPTGYFNANILIYCGVVKLLCSPCFSITSLTKPFGFVQGLMH